MMLAVYILAQILRSWPQCISSAKMTLCFLKVSGLNGALKPHATLGLQSTNLENREQILHPATVVLWLKLSHVISLHHSSSNFRFFTL
jgi:hypothetical protein